MGQRTLQTTLPPMSLHSISTPHCHRGFNFHPSLPQGVISLVIDLKSYSQCFNQESNILAFMLLIETTLHREQTE